LRGLSFLHIYPAVSRRVVYPELVEGLTRFRNDNAKKCRVGLYPPQVACPTNSLLFSPEACFGVPIFISQLVLRNARRLIYCVVCRFFIFSPPFHSGLSILSLSKDLSVVVTTTQKTFSPAIYGRVFVFFIPAKVGVRFGRVWLYPPQVDCPANSLV